MQLIHTGDVHNGESNGENLFETLLLDIVDAHEAEPGLGTVQATRRSTLHEASQKRH